LANINNPNDMSNYGDLKIVLKKTGILNEVYKVYQEVSTEFNENKRKDPKTNLTSLSLYASYNKSKIKEALENLQKKISFDRETGRYKNTLVFGVENNQLTFNSDNFEAIQKINAVVGIENMIKIVKDIKNMHSVDVIEDIETLETNFKGIVNPIGNVFRKKE